MNKRLVRNCVAAACHGSGMLTIGEGRNRSRLTILCYHRILPADRKAAYFNPDLVVTPESFRLHCRTLAEYFDVLPLGQAIDLWRRRTSAQRPVAVVTFDDGYRDNYEYAAPVLDEVGLRATFFVTAGLMDTQTSAWYDRLGRLISFMRQQGRALNGPGQPLMAGLLGGSPGGKDPADATAWQLVSAAKALESGKRQALLEELQAAAGCRNDWMSEDLIMNRRELTALAEAGHEIGSHSLMHDILPQLDDTALKSEVAGSRRLLEAKLDRPVQAFCYPNGDADDRVVRAVRTAGYALAVTMESGSNEPTQDLCRLKRWFIHEDRLSGPRGRVSATLLRMELCGLAHRVFRRRQACVSMT